MGNCLASVGGKGWGIDIWPVVGMMDGGSPAGKCGLSSVLVLSLYFLSLYFPNPSDQLSPIFPVPFVPLISHNNDTRAPTARC